MYVGNYEYDASERELERTFDKYGEVDRVEYKSGAPPPTFPCATTDPCHPAPAFLVNVVPGHPVKTVCVP